MILSASVATTVQVTVTGASKHPPYFSQTYSTSVPEGIALRTSILNVTATDPDPLAGGNLHT